MGKKQRTKWQKETWKQKSFLTMTILISRPIIRGSIGHLPHKHDRTYPSLPLDAALKGPLCGEECRWISKQLDFLVNVFWPLFDICLRSSKLSTHTFSVLTNDLVREFHVHFCWFLSLHSLSCYTLCGIQWIFWFATPNMWRPNSWPKVDAAVWCILMQHAAWCTGTY